MSYMGKRGEKDNPFEGTFVGRAEFTIGTETNDAINVTVQLYTGPIELYAPGSVTAYLSDNADGSSLAASAPSGGWVIGTDGLQIPIVTNKAAIYVSEDDGVFDVTITESSAKTFYMAIILPDGSLTVSDAITFV